MQYNFMISTYLSRAGKGILFPFIASFQEPSDIQQRCPQVEALSVAQEASVASKNQLLAMQLDVLG
jgi:hypothetical protein